MSNREHILMYIRCCENYREYPFNNLRHIAFLNILSRHRYMLELQLAHTDDNDTERIIYLQRRLNELPIYLCPASTLKLWSFRKLLLSN